MCWNIKIRMHTVGISSSGIDVTAVHKEQIIRLLVTFWLIDYWNNRHRLYRLFQLFHNYFPHAHSNPCRQRFGVIWEHGSLNRLQTGNKINLLRIYFFFFLKKVSLSLRKDMTKGFMNFYQKLQSYLREWSWKTLKICKTYKYVTSLCCKTDEGSLSDYICLCGHLSFSEELQSNVIQCPFNTLGQNIFGAVKILQNVLKQFQFNKWVFFNFGIETFCLSAIQRRNTQTDISHCRKQYFGFVKCSIS